MSAPDPNYDLLATLPPGVVLQRSVLDALVAAYVANGCQPLSAAQALAAVGPSPAYPASLPRFPDSNPDPWGR